MLSAKVGTFVDFLADRLASEPEWGSGASVDHDRLRHQLRATFGWHTQAWATAPLMISLAMSGTVEDREAVNWRRL